MSSLRSKNRILENSIVNFKKELNNNDLQDKIKIFKRTIENNTHEVIEDCKLKNITTWRKSEKKFLKNLIFNILSFGILHIISLFYPKLYLKLYCNPWSPKECDYFLVENIYGQFTLCTKIHKKSKNNNNFGFNSDIPNEKMISSSSFNYNKNENYLIRNLTYSFIYKSVTYEYIEENNEIIPVYMDLSKMTNKGILNFFSDGLYSEELIKKVKDRYGKNEYYIYLELLYYYFFGIELPYIVLVILISIIEFVLKDYISLIAKYIISTGIIFGLYLIGRKIIYGIYPKEYTLDGEENKLKVKRRHKITNNTEFYYEIKNCDLLPGDILYLKTNDFVPCDCLILEGECIISESGLTGRLNSIKKTSLENNNEQFNYKLNHNKILYHGVKIIKTYSKLNEGYISALCINIGPNTFKANQLSNILYLLERKKSYKEMYSFLGGHRKNLIIISAIIFTFSLALGVFYYFVLYYDPIKMKDPNIKRLLYTSIIRIFTKSIMPVFLLTNSIIIILGLYHLTKENIYGFEKSKLLHSYSIDTIFFCKTGTLCENNFEINSYHPVYMNPHKSNSISYKTYKINQCKEMNSQLLKYYKDYLFKTQNNILNQNFNLRHGLKVDLNQLNTDKINKEAYECTTLFLECLLSCNNLEKYNIEIFGNNIETSIFKNMGWDIKANNINNDENIGNDYSFIEEGNNKSYIRYDIYPNNYYKITESTNAEAIPTYKPIITRFNSKFYLEQMKKSFKAGNLEESKKFNYIKNDIAQCHINSYKLRIYKKFQNENTSQQSAIVYNFITKELRFMTRGAPEDILDKCDLTTLPDNFDKIISLFRKNGLIIIICASKIINIDAYNDSNNIEEYMNELTFCGFMTLKNKLKKEVVNSIKDLKQYNCNLNILTGDNIYNSLSVGFESRILENKNVFSFDKDDKKNGIIITKIYGVKKLNEEEDNKSNVNTSLDKTSRQTSKISNRLIYSPYLKRDKTKNSDNNIRASKTKNSSNIDFILQTNQDNSKSDNEYKNVNKRKRMLRRGSIKRNFKNTKNLLLYDEFKNQQKCSKLNTDFSDSKNNQLKTENSSNSKISNMNSDKNQPSDILSKKNRTTNDNQDTNTNRRYKNGNEFKNKSTSYIEKYYYYPGIFSDHEELSNNCIYCISGKAFNFLYKNKGKRQCKYILEKIHKNCKIFYNMTSLEKSLTIDFYREYPNSYICTIGECQSDIDAIMTSNVGIILKAPKNRNTIFGHFFSGNSDILSIKKIIQESRAINENENLLRINCIFYTFIINSYIICCFIRQVDVILGQLNFLEIFFFIFSISAFTAETDKNKKCNTLIQNKKLYLGHYFTQVIGFFFIKFFTVYLHGKNFVGNNLLNLKYVDYIYCSYYFILCIEQLFSTVFVLNFISFYRKDAISNIFFIISNLILMFYFVIVAFLNSSNYNWDFLSLTYFEFFEYLIDTYDDHNRINCIIVCVVDFFLSLIYSKIVYFIFDKLAQKK